MLPSSLAGTIERDKTATSRSRPYCVVHPGNALLIRGRFGQHFTWNSSSSNCITTRSLSLQVDHRNMKAVMLPAAWQYPSGFTFFSDMRFVHSHLSRGCFRVHLPAPIKGNRSDRLLAGSASVCALVRSDSLDERWRFRKKHLDCLV